MYDVIYVVVGNIMSCMFSCIHTAGLPRNLGLSGAAGWWSSKMLNACCVCLTWTLSQVRITYLDKAIHDDHTCEMLACKQDQFMLLID